VTLILLATHSPFLGLSVSDLVAIGGLGAFAATIGLAALAWFQARQMREQVVAIRETAADQISEVRQAAEEQMALVREQVDASIAQTETLRELASVQMRPVIVARPVSGWIFGPGGPFDLYAKEAVLPYYLTNEGTGVGLNVHHRIDVGGRINAMGIGPSIFGIRPGESFPPAQDEKEREPAELLYVSLYDDDIPEGLKSLPLEFRVDFQNLFGEKLEGRFDYSPRTLAHAISKAQVKIVEPSKADDA
jgi:hypothetical protein